MAAMFAGKAIWLGIAAFSVSVGNVLVHAFLFNIRGRTFYNPGLFTSVVLFLPLAVFFFYSLVKSGIAEPADWAAGIVLGAILNYVGIFKTIEWMKDPLLPTSSRRDACCRNKISELPGKQFRTSERCGEA